jgi:putative ABC transport system permease protein
VERILVDAGSTAVDQVPVVTARIARIDGRPVEELAGEAEDGGRSRRMLTREQRLTWREELTPDNEIVDGALWSDPDTAEVSVEKRYAERLGIGVGSTIEFDVQGVPVTLRVTSIRTVEWQSFAINFFLVAEPGVLERAPALYLANARVPEENEGAVQDRLAAEFPSVTVLRVRPILDQALELIGRIAAGIHVLACSRSSPDSRSWPAP